MSVNKDIRENFNEEQREVLESIRLSRIILPIIIGVGVVGYLFWRQYSPEDFAKINWTRHTAFWVGVSVLFLIIRHLAYATRLRILSDKAFSWKKCIELIFIWEFSSAVSPTSVGGSAVALFILAQEKLSTAKTTTIVLYSAILDTIFFLSTVPILLLIFGPEIIRPGMEQLYDIDGWGYTIFGRLHADVYLWLAVFLWYVYQSGTYEKVDCQLYHDWVFEAIQAPGG